MIYLLYISDYNFDAVKARHIFLFFLFRNVAYSLAGPDASFRPIPGRKEGSVKD